MMSGRCRISTEQRRAIVMPQGFAAAMACISDGVVLWWHHSTMPWLRNGFMLRWHSAVVLRHYSIAMLWWLTELMLMMLVVVLLPVTRLDHDRSGRFYGRYLKPANTLLALSEVQVVAWPDTCPLSERV